MNAVRAVVFFKAIEGHRAEALAHGVWDGVGVPQLSGKPVYPSFVTSLTESARADAAAGYNNLLFANSQCEMLLSPAFAEAKYNGLQLIVSCEWDQWIPTVSTSDALFMEGAFVSMESAQAAAVRRAAALLGEASEATAVAWSIHSK